MTFESRPNPVVRIFLVMSAVVVIGAFAVAAYVTLNGNPGLLRFGSSTTPAPVRAAVTASPAPASAAATTLPDPSSTPTPSGPAEGNEGSAVVARFVQLVSPASLSFHVQVTATLYSGSDSASLKASIDQSGHDLAAQLTVKGKTVRLIEKDGAAYGKESGSPWVKGAAPPDASLGTFPRLSSEPIQYVGLEKLGGEQLHHLIVAVLPNQNDAAQQIARQCGTRTMPIDFWVRSDGTPVSAVIHFECKQSGQSLGFRETMDFSQFGKPIAIKPPAHYVTR